MASPNIIITLPQEPEFTGPVRGESEGEISPHYYEVYQPLDEQTKEIGRVGIAGARKALKEALDKE
jgi:hypothetical protein